MKKAVIFDLDGTLADTLTSIAYCANRALSDMGFPVIGEKETYKRMVGNGARMQMVRALRMVGDAEGAEIGEPDADGFLTSPVHTEAVLERYMAYFKKDCTYQVKPYEGISELLQKLKERGVKLAVFSNKPDENAKRVVDTLFGEGYFSIVQGQVPELRKKPAPDGVFEILNRLCLKKEDVLYVGDSSVDMDTGRAAGVRTVGVLWGFRTRQELLEHGADALIERPAEVLLQL